MPSPRPPSHAEAVERYRRRIDHLRDQHTQLAARLARQANLRMTAFLAALALGVAVFLVEPSWQTPVAMLAGVALVWFILLVRSNNIARRQTERVALLRDANLAALARLQRRWNQLPAVRVPDSWKARPEATDLDLVGHASLVQLLGSVATPGGRSELLRMLLEATPPAELPSRQSAVAELAEMAAWREEFAAMASPLAESDPDTEPFLQWAESPGWLIGRPWLLWATRLIPLTILMLAALQLSGIVEANWWLVPTLASMIISFGAARRVHETFDNISSRAGDVSHYAELLALVANLKPQDELLQRLAAQVHTAGDRADWQLDRLRRLMDMADMRYSPMIYLPMQLLTLWDFHILAAAENWQRRHGHQARGWFATLAELENLAALATLAHDHPDWAFPVVDPQASSIAATGLGHPLIAPEARVSNDVQVGPPHTFLLVTGSNMSGKSTLLRSIGTNVTLAQCGGPVCATTLTLPPLRIATSMRIQDSLEAGVSFFMAELKRLAEIVEAARDQANRPRLLYLLDEILQGTNTAERQVAVRRVVEHLLACGAIGAVTTHDLHLADAEELAKLSVPVHFRESFTRDADGRPKMQFDYQLRQGIATTTNALKLLEIVGLADSSETE